MALAPDFYRNGGRGQGIPGYAVVRQERDSNLARGRNMVRFADVAALIDPTTVVFESLTDGKGTTVLEQNYQFDLVSTEKLLQRYIDRPIASSRCAAAPPKRSAARCCRHTAAWS